MISHYRELYVNKETDEVVYTEDRNRIVIGFRKMLLTLSEEDFKTLLLRFDHIINDASTWKNDKVKSVMVQMPFNGLQMLFTYEQAEQFYSLLLNAFVVL